jgi:proteasome lid subunit RPN8/RPN11
MTNLNLSKIRPRWQDRFDRPPRPGTLLFDPLAWLKLQYLCHAGPTEVGGFGLSHPDNPLHVIDVLVVRQKCTMASVAFDDASVADLFDDLATAGVPPRRFGRIWIHTHPGSSVEPSWVDEATFARVFGRCDWSVMAILGRTGRMSARLQFTAGPGGSISLPSRVDWSAWPDHVAAATGTLADHLDDWRHEYQSLVETEAMLRSESPFGSDGLAPPGDNFFAPLPGDPIHHE